MIDELNEMIEEYLSRYYYLLVFGQRRISSEPDEELRKQLFDSLSRVIAEDAQIEPLEYTEDRANNVYKEMTDHVKKSLLKREYAKNQRVTKRIQKEKERKIK